jgi:hypothetical protein
MMRSWPVVLLLFLASLSSCSTGGDDLSRIPFPLKISADGRYLIDQHGDPFLMKGDAPQSLMVNASLSEAEFLLANRASHGFNIVWIMLLCNRYCGGRVDASTIDGILPFTTPSDLSTPNEAYFAHCDKVLRSAASHGLTVILDPIETGGFLGMLRENGVDKCMQYGRYLGNRYKDFENIIWMSGSDFQTWEDPVDDALVKAVAMGIKEAAPHHIHTLQLDYPLSSSFDDPNWWELVTLNAAYTRYPIYAEVLRDYNRTPVAPVFIIEAAYESDEHDTDPERLRRQEYWTYLAGGCGHVYGNHIIWPMLEGWRDNLDTVGVIQFGFCTDLIQSRPWYSLIPDQLHALVTAGYGTYESGGLLFYSIDLNDYATAASTPDGKLALVYIPTARTITVDLRMLSGSVTARWYDPTAGTYSNIVGSPFPNASSHDFATPGLHADGGSDWVLVLETQ